FQQPVLATMGVLAANELAAALRRLSRRHQIIFRQTNQRNHYQKRLTLSLKNQNLRESGKKLKHHNAL
ncbi:hypothetical protein CBW54_22380, partial [Yersinia kristensenii]